MYNTSKIYEMTTAGNLQIRKSSREYELHTNISKVKSTGILNLIKMLMSSKLTSNDVRRDVAIK